MAAPQVEFPDPDHPGRTVSVDADPQAVVAAGDRPDTARVILPSGRQTVVAGDYREVHVQLQAAAASAHERRDDRPAPTGG